MADSNFLSCLKLASLAIALACTHSSNAVVLLNENFDALPFGTTVERSAGTESAWTKTPPTGWAIDDSQMPGTLGGADDGTREFYGWNFMQKSFFEAAGQNRELFTLASGGVAVADPDEWDDADNPAALFNSFLKTPTLNLGGARAVNIRFDSSWRPEGFDDAAVGSINNQTATITANYTVGGSPVPVEVLRWDSNPNGPFFKADSENEQVLISLIAPAGAQSIDLNFGMTQAYNDWWWAFDNLVVETFNPVVLEVDTATGNARLVGTSDEAVAKRMFSYELSSPSGSLTPAAWETTNLDAQNVGSGSGPGDYNGDGAVDAADYTVWRDGNASVGGPAGYQAWAQNYGGQATGEGSQWETVIRENDLLSEAFLLGESILDGSFSRSIGNAFQVGGQQDLKFEYAGPDGVVTEALVVYVNSATAGAVTVPEPSTLSLGAIAMGLLLGRKRRRTPSVVLSAAAVAAVVGSGAASLAAVTVDREYSFGENDSAVKVGGQFGPAAIGTRVGANTISGLSRDNTGVPASEGGVNEVIPLGVVNATNSPIYRDVSAGPLARPFAAPGEIGLEFTSTAGLSALRAEPLGSPSQSRSSSTSPGGIYVGGAGPYDYEGVTNRGYQFWVRPSRVNVNQVMVYDTDQHVVGISSNGRWFMQYRRTRPTATSTFGAVNDLTVDTTVPQSLAQANQWYHVMMVRPYGAGRKFEDPNPTDNQFPGDTDVSLGPNGGARLYINGVAVAAETGGFDTSLNYNFGTGQFLGDSLLYVGGFGPTAATGNFGGIQQPFVGVMDDLEMFVTGTSFAGTQFGNFDLASDNGYISNALQGISGGDLNLDGFEDATDVNAFVGGWLSRNLVNGLAVGDLRSRAKGDVNLDGIVNLQDWSLINQSSPGTGMAIGQALGFIAVPEPTTLLLAALASLAAARRARRD